MENESHGNVSLYSRRDVCRILEISMPTLLRLYDTGRIPKPVKIASGLYWAAADLDPLFPALKAEKIKTKRGRPSIFRYAA